jgi:hypothetical protein
MIERLQDHTVRVWRPVTVPDAIGADQRTYAPVGEPEPAKVNRNVAPTGDAGPGFAAIGRRRLYMKPGVDVEERDVLELVTGPDAPQTLEVDEPPTRPRGHHCQVDCILWRGQLPELES